MLFPLALLLFAAPSARAWTPTLEGAAPLAAGFAAGLGLHEAAHWAVVLSTGQEPHWRGASIVYDTSRMTRREHLFSSSAGTLSNWLTTETAFALTNEDPGDFAAGVIFSEILTAAAYVTVLYSHEEGDVTGISKASGVGRPWIAAAMALPAALDAWRLLDAPLKPSWGRVVPVASRSAKALGLVWVLSF